MAWTIRVLEVASHRNGIGGEPFYALRFESKYRGEKKELMVAVVFRAAMHTAVLSLDKLCGEEPTVLFGDNSYRGDCFDPALRQAIADFEALRDETYARGDWEVPWKPKRYTIER